MARKEVMNLKYWGKEQLFSILLVGWLLSGGDATAGPSMVRTKSDRNCHICHMAQNKKIILPPRSPDIQGQNFQPAKHADICLEINSSKACLSCHDGTIGRDQAISFGEEAKNAASIDLGRSHPVSVDYNASFSRKRRNLRHPSTLSSDIRLFNGKVECGTCHDIHASFHLRTSKRVLCTSCHNM